jgi:hypothetical protein
MEDEPEDLLAPAPPDPITRADWAELIHCRGWQKIVLPLLSQIISGHEQSILTSHDSLTKQELRKRLTAQSTLRDFLSLLDSRARQEFESKVILEDHIAANLIKRAFTLPATFQVAIHSAPSTAPTAPPMDPADFGQEPNPFAGAVEARPTAKPPPESPTP